MAKFFIERPVFAWVIAIFMMLAGIMSIHTLPVSQYPEVTPPSVYLRGTYPGASAQTVQDSVAQVIEQSMTGIDNMRYMESSSSSNGQFSLTITFEPGTDPDIAQMQVQNKLQLAMPVLPKEVQTQGIVVGKNTGNMMMMIGFYSEDGSMNESDIADFIATTVQDPVSRVPGVGNAQFFGAKYAMRIWLLPEALSSYSINISEVVAAIQAQNIQVSGGELGGQPATPGTRLNATIVAQSRLTTVEEFQNILLRVNPDGSQVRLSDIARIEKDRESYSFRARFNGKPSAGLGIMLATGANALATSDAVHTVIDNLSRYFPPGLNVVYPMDTAPFIRLSIEEVVKTLIEAIVLVFLVMYLFLQNIRATLIPTIAVPVVLLGTFAVLALFGFSINTLTMFGLVLAIGLLVDDAIVVVENVERIMHEEGLSAHDATVKSMGQITGALVGIAMVLAAVFVPMAFMPGSTGVIYRQFSITIASAMALSVIVALVLTPTLCSALLKPKPRDAHASQRRGFFGWFNNAFDRGSSNYERGIGGIVRRPLRFVIIYLLLGLGLVFVFKRLPTSFLPEEDQGFAIMMAMLPPGSTQEQTLAVLAEVENYFHENESEAVESTFTIAGFSLGGGGQNTAMGFLKFRPWEERLHTGIINKLLTLARLQKPQKDNSAAAVANRAMGYFLTRMKVAITYVQVPPAIPQLGMASGFEVRLQDLSGMGHNALTDAKNQLLHLASANPAFAPGTVRLNGLDDTPQLRLDIDLEKAAALSLNLAEVYNTISVAWGSSYIGDFVDRGRTKRVYIQSDAPYRMLPEDFAHWYVRNNLGRMVPFSDFTSTRWEYGPTSLNRFNGFPSMTIQGSAAPGRSTGEAMSAVQNLIETKLPNGVGFSWSGLSYEEKQAGAQTTMLYAITIIVVFLCLAALYESWTIPFSVILAAPLGVLGAVLAVWARGLNNDIYFYVGFLTTIGLTSKNGILIVEFAKEGFDKGMGLVEATMHAARIRLRPILMTSLAFGCGVIPLAIATGAGAGSQNAIGTSVLGGVITGTLLAIFFVPLFYVGVTKLFRGKPRNLGEKPENPKA